MINIYKVEDLSVVGKDGIVSICVRDRKNDTSNTFDVEVGTTDATFCFNMKSENLVGNSLCLITTCVSVRLALVCGQTLLKTLNT